MLHFKKEELKTYIEYFDSKDSHYWFYLHGAVKYSHIEELEDLGCKIIRYSFSDFKSKIRFLTPIKKHIIDFHEKNSTLCFEEIYSSRSQ